MKTLLLALALCCTVPLANVGCQTAPSARAVQYQTLGVLGQTAKAGIDGAALLLKTGKITVAQWREVASAYDTRWQPAYNLAVSVARSDLTTVASPDVQKLASEFMEMVAQLSTPR